MSRSLRGDAPSVARRTLESRDFAASATDAALDAVGALCAAARSHGADLSALSAVARSAGGGGAEGVARAVGDLVGSTRTLLSRALDQGSAQHDVATRGVGVAALIAGLAREVTGIMAEARLLAINANIASTRLGHTGMASAVIATRVQGLAAELAGEARSLADLSSALSEALPRIADRSGALRTSSSGLSDRSSELLAEIEASRASMGEQIAAEVVASERRVAQVIEHAQRIDAQLREHRGVEALLDHAGSSAASGDTRATFASLDRAAERSLSSIAPASEHLLALNGVAAEQTEALARLADALAQDGGSDSIGEASQALRGAVAGFVESSRRTIEEQRGAIDAAAQHAARGRGITEGCRRLVLEARMLTLAIRVEAGRIGGSGAELLQIAAQLDTFTRRLDDIMSGADTNTRELRALLAQLEAGSRSVADSIGSFARTAPQLGAALDLTLERAANDAREALSASRERADAVLAASHELVTCLQFQDRLTQELRLLQSALTGEAPAPEKSFLQTSHKDGSLASGELVLF